MNTEMRGRGGVEKSRVMGEGKQIHVPTKTELLIQCINTCDIGMGWREKKEEEHSIINLSLDIFNFMLGDMRQDSKFVL